MMWKLEGAPSGISATDSLQSVIRRSLLLLHAVSITPVVCATSGGAAALDHFRAAFPVPDA